MPSLVTFLVLIVGAQLALPAKILVYNPHFAQSHVNFMASIGRILTEEGHQVTVLSPVLDANIRVDASKFTTTTFVPIPKEIVTAFMASLEGWDCWTFNSYDVLYINRIFSKQSKALADSCRYLLKQTKVIEVLRAQNFDLAISEYMDACGIGLKKTILATSTHLFEFQLEDFGILKAPAYVPGIRVLTWPEFAALDSEIPVEELASSIWARLKNAYLSLASQFTYRLNPSEVETVFIELYPNFPTFKELAAQASLILTNSNPLLDFPRPTLHKVVDIGGLHVEAVSLVPEQLNDVRVPCSTQGCLKEWNEILRRREQNVLVSFGSVAKSVNMPPKTKQAIVEVARRFPDVTFVWKYEEPDDEVGRDVTNLVKVAWTPQHDLLRELLIGLPFMITESGHLNAFLTHGGMGSTNEGVNSGVPLMLVGLFSDQMRNAAMTATHGGAIALSKWRLDDADSLTGAMNKILEDPSYAQKARRLAAQLKARPFSSRELLVRHVAFVAEHGPLHQLTPVSVKMNVLQRHLVDVVAVALMIAVSIVLSLIVLVWWFCSRNTHIKTE